MDHPALERFSPATRAWFAERFAAPSPPQLLGWPAIAGGQHTLIAAATGSGKTLAAFLWCLDRLAVELAAGDLPRGIHTLYVSPLKALSYDIERNLREPLQGIRAASRRLGLPAPAIRVAVRTGDTSPAQRASMLRSPPQLLITTPESLFILLSSPRARPLLASVRYLILDEIHSLVPNKRGMGLALSLERLAELTAPREPVRIGLSATVRPLETAARFLGGLSGPERPRPVTIVDAGARKQLDLEVSAAAEDFAALPADARSVWPSLEPRLLALVQAHASTLIFVRMRAQAERLARALNELAGAPIARAHHSSLAREIRRELEGALKRGELRALISTGTMELGIDMASVELVVQLGSPGSVAAGLQRVGRAGHLVDRESRGRIVALHREDLVECAAVAGRMLEAKVEELRLPGGGLDVLAQHVLSEAAVDPELTGARVLAIARRAAPYAALGREALDTVLALLGGRYPAEVARGLTSKLSWERSTDRIAALPGARQLVVTAGGTIPDAGYYALQLTDGSRLGELEEEFVYERKLGDVISFGTQGWRILGIDGQRVTVAPAPGQPAVIPFWKGGLFGRDPELSLAIGALRRELYERADDEQAAAGWLRARLPLDDRAIKLHGPVHVRVRRAARRARPRPAPARPFAPRSGPRARRRGRAAPARGERRARGRVAGAGRAHPRAGGG
jgi:ATP-dependent Lhr-like helicase